MLNASQKDNVLDFNLQEALNDLIQEGIRDPNILLKYSQNPPPEYGANGNLLVSLAANAVARSKQAAKTVQPSPNTTIAEQVQTKLASAAQPQGIAGLAPQAPTTPQGINTPPPPQNMDGGIAPLPIDDTMYNDQNYAGGGIVSFATGNRVTSPEKYKYKYDYEKYYDDPASSLMEVPTIPTADDLKMETQALKSNFVDPTYYASQEKTLKDQTLEDVAESKKMGQSDILFRLAKGFQTPGSFLKGAAAAGVEAGPAVSEMNKNMIAAKRLNRDAVNKLNQAKYAESIGDFKTAMELKESAKKDNFEAKKTNATLNTQIGLARAKALKGAGLDEAKLRVQVEKVAVEKMKAQYPGGAFETLMRDRPDVYSAELNRYKKETEGYILNNITAKNLPPNYMDNLQGNNKANATLSGKSGTKSTKAPITAQPANRTNLLNKYPATGSRSTNTAAEMQLTDPMYDNMGDQDDDYLQ
tara:strand:- start:23805 stop:25217 length:1413 start_codon:yes stop_codon:yes gene_type:complete